MNLVYSLKELNNELTKRLKDMISNNRNSCFFDIKEMNVLIILLNFINNGKVNWESHNEDYYEKKASLINLKNNKKYPNIITYIEKIKERADFLYKNQPHDDEWDCPFEELEYFILREVEYFIEDGEQFCWNDSNEEMYYHPAFEK